MWIPLAASKKRTFVCMGGMFAHVSSSLPERPDFKIAKKSERERESDCHTHTEDSCPPGDNLDPLCDVFLLVLDRARGDSITNFCRCDVSLY